MRLNLQHVCVVLVTGLVLSMNACKQEAPTGASETANASRAAGKDAYLYGIRWC